MGCTAQELKHGKTDKLMALLISLSNTVRGAASSTYAFVKAELEEHTPQPVKQKVRLVRTVCRLSTTP